jgi:hypothetical protein
VDQHSTIPAITARIEDVVAQLERVPAVFSFRGRVT